MNTLRTLIQLLLITILFSCSSKEDIPNSTKSTDNKSNNNQQQEDKYNIPKLLTVKTFGGSMNESAQKIIPTKDGGYAIIGYSQSQDGDVSKNDGTFDILVMKYTSNHALQWYKTFGGSDNDRGSDIIQTKDGGYAIIGYAYSKDGDITNNHGLQEFWIAKLNNVGEIEWKKTLGYTGLDYGESILETEDGYFITGVLDVTASEGKGDSMDTIPDLRKQQKTMHAGGDYWAVKMNKSGDVLWTRYFGGMNTDTPYDAIQTDEGDFILAGSSDSSAFDIDNNLGVYDFWVLKLSSDGKKVIWKRNFGGTLIDAAWSIIKTNDNHFVMAGDTRSTDKDVSNNKGDADLWLVKMDTNGSIIWENTYGGTDFDVGRSIYETQDKGLVIAGSTRSSDIDVKYDKNDNSGYGQNDGWIIKTDKNGKLLWQQPIGGTDFDFFYGVTQLINGTIIAVGDTSSNDINITNHKGFDDLLIATFK